MTLVSGMVGAPATAWRQSRVDTTSPTAHYLGLTESATAAEGDAKWLVVRLTRPGGIFSVELAGGEADRTRSWTSRASYFAAPTSAPVDPAVPQTASVLKTTTASVAANTSALICADNPRRVGLTVWNNSSNSCYISFESPASSAAPVTILATFQTWTHPPGVIYTGPVYAIRNAGTGTWTTWEWQTP
jgi:hypothetical protein